MLSVSQSLNLSLILPIHQFISSNLVQTIYQKKINFSLEMPRPGPRPYECVRRAWHSDRHQPIRESLIQEIFRLANDAHNPTTRKNGEWLEKLPLVVLKMEEIMYSKANSEAEYMDLNTLWDRTNDAIDTIIRRDDSNETEGDMLQPCIEAALNLGCIPRRASRSQRHNNPGCYLNSVNKGAQHLLSSINLLPSSTNLQSSLSVMESWYAALVASYKVNHFGNEVNSVPSMDFLLNYQDRAHTYPLYYSNEQPKETSNASQTNPQDLPANHTMHNFIGSDNAKSVANVSSMFREASENPNDGRCDLSLRLGQFSPPSLDSESAWGREFGDVGSSSSGNGSKYSDPSSREIGAKIFDNSLSFSEDKDFYFIPVDTSDKPLESCSSKWSSEEEVNVAHQGL